MRTPIEHTGGQRSRISCIRLAACERDIGVTKNGQVLIAVIEASGQVAESGAVRFAGWRVSMALDIRFFSNIARYGRLCGPEACHLRLNLGERQV